MFSDVSGTLSWGAFEFHWRKAALECFALSGVSGSLSFKNVTNQNAMSVVMCMESKLVLVGFYCI